VIFEVDKEGKTKFLYSEEYTELMDEAICEIKRASNVEPCPDNCWKAYMLEDGVILGPFKKRSEALEAEVKYLENKMKEG
jgi:hypothetical protein